MDFPWPDFDDPDFPFLVTIDPYGHTYWSEMQIQHGLEDELERLASRLTTEEQRSHHASIMALIDRIRHEGQGPWFLTFHGD